MKRLYAYMIMASLSLTMGMTSCNDDDETILPTVDLEAMHFTYEPGPGQITLKWDAPADAENAGFMYMTMTYTDPRDKVTRTKSISPYTKEILIPDTRARYGNTYSFTFVPYSVTDAPGTPYVLDKCHSDPAPATTTVTRTKLNLANLQTNAQEPSEGPLENLTDGNVSNYFHTMWSENGGPEPMHWVDMDLGEEVDRLEIHTWNRSGSGSNNPTEVKLYRLAKVGDTDVDMENGAFYTYKHPNQAVGAECQVMYPEQDSDPMTEPVRYLRYYAKSASAKFWHLAEMEINKVTVNVFDPETDEKEVGE